MEEKKSGFLKPKVTIVGYSIDNLNRYAKQIANLFDEQVDIEVLTIKEIKEKNNYFSDCILIPTCSISLRIE